jgi:peptidyl-prolyl cis-trans isomerase C
MTLVVNGEQIEEKAIRKEAERLRPEYEKVFVDMKPEEREAQLLDWSRENLIERTLLQQEAKNTEPQTPKAHLEPILANLKKNCRDPQELYRDFEVEDDENLGQAVDLIIRTEKTIEKLLQDMPKPSNAEIRRYYEDKKEQFKSGEKIKVAHIVKYVDWQTDESTAYQALHQAYDELKQGAPFETVVDKYTDCADPGGDLGYVERGEMAEEFEDVVFNLGTGQVSDIFRTRFGLHIAKVYEIQPATVPDFEEVKDKIAEIIYEQMRLNAIHHFIDNLKNKAKIEDISETALTEKIE